MTVISLSFSFFSDCEKTNYRATSMQYFCNEVKEISMKMNKKIAKVILTLAVAATVLSPLTAKAKASKPATRVVVDHDGDKVTIPAVVNRVAVVSIWPLPSVITVFLNGTDKLVGIPPASMGAAKAGLLGQLYPSILKLPTNYTNGEDVNVEELLKLNPDVVFCSSRDPKMKQTLQAAGLTAVAFSVNKWNYDILATYDGWIDLLSQVFPDHAKKDQVSAYSKKTYDEVQAKVKSIAPDKRRKVLFLFQYNDKTIVTSGKKFFGQSWCDEVNAKNVAEEVGAENANAVINMEQIYTWNPDVILITNFTPAVPDDLYNNKIGGNDWSSVNAVKNHEVYKMPLGTYRSYTPSADTPVTLLWIAQKVYPELFKDVDIVARVRSYFKELYGIELTDDQVKTMYNQTASGATGIRLN
jgi:iron complex transport system substrate-binding protein